jgi:uncharacterized protein YjbI with pentapeptide repeats
LGTEHRQGAIFHGPVTFANAIFTHDVGLNEARFEGGVSFDGATFQRDAFFQQIVVHQGAATFRRAQFSGLALFASASFEGDASFTDASFERGVSFGYAVFRADADFDRVRTTQLDFIRCRFKGDLVSLSGADVQELRLTRVFSTAQVEADVVGEVIALTEAVFSEGASIRCRSAKRPASLVLDGARFGERSFVAGHGEPAPVLASMRATDASDLTLSGVALEHCHFHGTHNLDRLRLEGSAFRTAPPGWRRAWPWPWRQRWTPRRVLAEEAEWRTRQLVRVTRCRRVTARWPDRVPMRWPEWTAVTPDGSSAALRPQDIATLYRSLRKGREDHKDEPGAADFYYGEMEMRRWAAKDPDAGVSRLDRLVLWLYWLTSGYALRASRAFVTLLLVVLLFAGLFETVGFGRDAITPRAVGVTQGRIVYETAKLPRRGTFERGIRALTYSAATATAVAGVPDRRLTKTGEALRILLRVLGPLLLALTAVSIRGRIKR